MTDSGASSTQIASGEWAGAEMIGIDPNGNRVKTIPGIAEEMGKFTGLVTDTGVTRTTPTVTESPPDVPRISREQDLLDPCEP